MTFLPQVPCPHVPMSPSQTLNTVVSWWSKAMFTGFSVRHFEAGACVVRPGGPGRPPADVSSPEMGIESRNMMILMVGLCWFMVGLLVGLWLNMIYYELLWYGMWWSDWLIPSVFFFRIVIQHGSHLSQGEMPVGSRPRCSLSWGALEFPPFSDVKTHGPWDTWRNCYP